MNAWQGWLYVAAVLLPLVAFTVQILAGPRLGRRGAWVATGAIGGAFVLSMAGLLSYLLDVRGEEGHSFALSWSGSLNWVALGGSFGGRPLAIPLGIFVDNLTAILFVMITFVATLVHVYSMEYMEGDPRFGRFFAYLSLFCFAMLGLVASANLFFVFVFWELVGLCSYLLIGFWREDEANSLAADKAFLFNRFGDVGMLIGLGLIWAHFGTFNIDEINRGLTARTADGAYAHRDADGRMTRASTGGIIEVAVHEEGSDGPATRKTIPYGWLTVAGLGLFAGCAAKSAQVPLHAWLPDAMAGPTPVSALIHAATMVAAGVYLVARVFPLFTAEALLVIAYAGGLTLIVGATSALVQSDYKKVLAYSTVSQLGFMLLALGVGGRSAGLFHLLTHACFKALLFLGAGSVFHAVGTYRLQDLGGLGRTMKVTAGTMLVATLAISGVPPFSGFYSKDAILAAAFYFARHHPSHWPLIALSVIGAGLTACYMFRLWFLLFAGEPRGEAAGHAHEGDRRLTWPLLALAVPTVVVGLPWTILPIRTPVLEQMLEYGEPLARVDMGSVRYLALLSSVLVAAIGMGLGVLYYGPWSAWRRLSAGAAANRFGPVYRFLVGNWYFDALNQALVIRPTLALARASREFDRRVIDGVVHGTAWAAVLASRAGSWIDVRVVDGLVLAVAAAVRGAGERSRRWQTGKLRHSLMVLSLGVIALAAGAMVWAAKGR